MVDLFIAVLASLFTVVNPIGAVPIYVSLSSDYSTAERRKTALHTSLYFFLILMTFFLAGSVILSFFGISLPAMRIAGGMVILSSGYGLLSGQFESARVDKKVKQEAKEKSDISFTPMAMPMLSGPGSISFLISQYSEHTEWTARGIIAAAIVALAGIVYFTLMMAPYLFKVLGEGGMRAISRIMGFLVMAIGIQYIIGGLVSLVDMFVNG